MKKYLVLATILGVLAVPLTPSVTFAEDGKGGYFKKKHHQRQKWNNATDEQKAKVKDRHVERTKDRIEKRHDKWEDMSDEERAAAKDKVKDRRATRREHATDKYENATDEQKARIDSHRDKVQDRRKNYRQKKRDYWKSLND